jgi:sugar phosphate isomerase/epimerase
MANISIMTMVFGGHLDRGTMTDAAMLAALEEMGYTAVEVPFRRIENRIEKYKTALAQTGLNLDCIDCICNFISREPQEREAAVRMLDAAIKAAVELRCPIVLAAGSNLSGDIEPDEGRQMIIDGMRACMPAASELGITLAIENFGVAPRLQCCAADCLAVLDAVPGLKFVFDTGNFYFRQEDPLKNLPLFAERICHVHLKDWIKSDKPDIADVAGVALGTGLIPNADLVEKLMRDGYTGDFSIELGAPGDKLKGARRDVATVRSWLE